MAVRGALVGVATLGVAFLGPVASAKGPDPGFAFDGYFVPGQRVSDVQLRRPAPWFMRRAPYFAYLRHTNELRFNTGWPSPPVAQPIPLGRVDLDRFRQDGKPRVEVRLSFVVPQLPTGVYEILICGEDCRHRARALETRLVVVATRAERRLFSAVDEVRSEVSRHAKRVIELAGTSPRRGQVIALEEQVAALEDRVDHLANRRPAEPSAAAGSSPLLAGMSVVAAAAVGIGIGKRMRRRTSRGPSPSS